MPTVYDIAYHRILEGYIVEIMRDSTLLYGLLVVALQNIARRRGSVVVGQR